MSETKFELSGMTFGGETKPDEKEIINPANTEEPNNGDPKDDNKTDEEKAADLAAAEKAKEEGAEANNGEGAPKTDENGKENSSKTESGSAEEIKSEGANEKPKEFNELLVEQSGGTFNSMDEVDAEIKRLTENQRTEQDDLDSDLYDKFKAYRQGRTGDANSIFKEFLNTQVQDFAEMDGDALLQYKIRMDYPSLSDANVELLMEDKYKSDEQEYSEKEVNLGKIRKEQDILNARKELGEMQSKSALSEPASIASTEEEELKTKEINEKWDQSITESMKDFKSVDIAIDDKGKKFSFEISNNKEISDAMLKPRDFFHQRYVDEKGKVDMEGYRRAITILTNLDKIGTALSINGVSLANEQHLETRTNPDKKDVGAADGTKEKSHTVGLGEALLAAI